MAHQRDEIEQADAFFVVSSVNFMVPHLVDVGEEGFTGYDDSWCAFANERDELIDLFEPTGRKVFVLTGDLHNSFVGKISDDVWEIASAPHNSTNARMQSEGERPPNGWFDSHGRRCFLRCSTWFDNRFAKRTKRQHVYCLVTVNNVFPSPSEAEPERWQAYPHPHPVSFPRRADGQAPVCRVRAARLRDNC